VNHFISQYWKIIVGLTAIFIGGLGFGGVIESLRHRHDPPPPPPTSGSDRDWIESTLGNLDQSLALSDQQKELIRPQIEAAAREILLSRESALLKFELSLLSLHRSIAPTLDEAQKKKLMESQQSLEKRIKKRSDDLLGMP
jgi:hypothetical protein